MNVFEAVDSRISCRWFLDTPVDPALVRDLIAGAARAASGGNLQPWQVYALTGAALAELKRQVSASIAGRDPRHEMRNIRFIRRRCGSRTNRGATIMACSFTARSRSTATMSRRG